MNAYRATEQFLKDYDRYKIGATLGGPSGSLARHNLKMVDAAIDGLKNERYIEIITRHYIEHETIEQIAADIPCDVRTVFRQRNRLIRKISVVLFPDDVIRERFGSVCDNK